MKLFKRKSKLEKNKDKAMFVCAMIWFVCALVLYIASRSEVGQLNLYLCGLFICTGILYLILAYKYKK